MSTRRARTTPEERELIRDGIRILSDIFGIDVAPRWTAVYVAGDNGGVIAYIEELPGALAEGATVDEARVNLREAVQMVLRANRRTTWEDFKSARVLHREKLSG